jgi:hypothetical protein
MSIKEAAYALMHEAYRIASAGGTLPANARQVMYAARPLILAKTGNDTLNDKYFTQTLLPDFVEDYRLDWNIVFDDRGHLIEPHTDLSIGLGALSVQSYLAGNSKPHCVPAFIAPRGYDQRPGEPLRRDPVH